MASQAIAEILTYHLIEYPAVVTGVIIQLLRDIFQGNALIETCCDCVLNLLRNVRVLAVKDILQLPY